MELSQLKYFKTVAETGKISAAAEELFLSAPALSNSISKLEKELGVQLFTRTSNSLAINQQGEILLRYANQILHTVDCAKSEIQQSLLKQPQHIWIATTITNLWFDLIASFSLEFPQLLLTYTNINSLNIHKTLTSRYTFFLAEEHDFATYKVENMDSLLLFEDQAAVMVSPSHPFAKKDSIDIHCLSAESLLLPPREQIQYAQFSNLFQENGLCLPEATYCAFSLSRHLVEGNSHVALTTMHSHRDPNLCYIPVASKSAPWKMKLYWRKDHPFTAEEEIFKSFVEDFYRISTE